MKIGRRSERCPPPSARPRLNHLCRNFSSSVSSYSTGGKIASRELNFQTRIKICGNHNFSLRSVKFLKCVDRQSCKQYKNIFIHLLNSWMIEFTLPHGEIASDHFYAQCCKQMPIYPCLLLKLQNTHL